ncbi:MAG: arsenate reductase ArsC [bacterium]
MSEPRGEIRILFVCIGNSCRSQMAEGWAKAMGGDRVEIYSAGSYPAGFVADGSTVVMQEVGISLADHHSKGLKDVPQGPYDAVVTMGCGDACPWIPANQRFDWNIEDPIGMPIEMYRETRDFIRGKVEELLKTLRVMEEATT